MDIMSSVSHCKWPKMAPCSLLFTNFLVHSSIYSNKSRGSREIISADIHTYIYYFNNISYKLCVVLWIARILVIVLRPGVAVRGDRDGPKRKTIPRYFPFSAQRRITNELINHRLARRSDPTLAKSTFGDSNVGGSRKRHFSPTLDLCLLQMIQKRKIVEWGKKPQFHTKLNPVCRLIPWTRSVKDSLLQFICICMCSQLLLSTTDFARYFFAAERVVFKNFSSLNFRCLLFAERSLHHDFW